MTGTSDSSPTPRSKGGRSDLRQRLIRSASSLFAHQGFENTSVQNVCDSVSVTKGGFYHHFRSKEELLYEIYGSMLRMQMSDLERVAALDAPLLSRLHTIARNVVESSIERLDEATVFWRSLHHLSPQMQSTVRAERRRYHELLRSLLEEGVEPGLVRADVPADLLIDFFYGTVHKLDAWYRQDGPLTGADVGDYYAELFISSIVPPGPRPTGEQPPPTHDVTTHHRTENT